MRPQFFPWLFDDKDAWEKAISNPHFNYELPMDYFMSIYQVERKSDGNSGGYSLPAFVAPIMPMPAAAPAFVAAPAFAAASVGVPFAAAPMPAEAKKEEPGDGILSQDEIDALLSGL